MSASFSPRLLKGGIVLIKPDSGQVVRVIALQYNPDTLTRTLQPQGISGESNNRAEATRLKGPPIETIKLDAEIDATDQLEFPDRNPNAVKVGVADQLAALETMIYPSSADLVANNSLQASGTLEIVPMEAPLPLFVWSKNRVVPVRITDFSVTEEAFDPALNPIRAKVSLGLRVLSVDDLGFDHRGGNIYLAYQRNKEALAATALSSPLSVLGLGRHSMRKDLIGPLSRYAQTDTATLTLPDGRQIGYLKRRFVPRHGELRPDPGAPDHPGRSSRQPGSALPRRSRTVLAACAMRTARCFPTICSRSASGSASRSRKASRHRRANR